VIQVIVHHQQAFLEAGDEFLQVLSVSLIAKEASLPETTVRMAVEGKWLQVPRGLFALRHLLKGFEAAKNGPPSLN
jgi:RNA polymerase sigma-54 factor